MLKWRMDEIRETEDTEKARCMRGNTREGIRDSGEGRSPKDKNQVLISDRPGVESSLGQLFCDFRKLHTLNESQFSLNTMGVTII